MKPVISLVGRTGVGKSSIFDLLTLGKNSKFSIPTRDRMYGTSVLNNKSYIVVDTGGIVLKASQEFDKLVLQQVQIALKESNVIFFVVDAKVGVTYEDLDIIKLIRKQDTPIVLIVNYANRLDNYQEFYSLGIQNIWFLNSLNTSELPALVKIMESIFDSNAAPVVSNELDENLIKIAILGRPNVGKSTLVNRLLGDERIIISDIAGTTLSSITIPYEHKGRKFSLIDTAGIRKRTKISDPIEKGTIYQSLRSIELADISICIIDSVSSIVDQDRKLINYVLKLGKPLIIVANKIDLLSNNERKKLKDNIMFQLRQAKFLQFHQISALKGIAVSVLMNLVHKTYNQISKKVSTSLLNEILLDAITSHPPPLRNKKRAKLKYAHMGSLNPHIIVIHGVRVKNIPKDYLRYLNNYFYEHLGLYGVQFRIVFKEQREK